MDIIDTPYWFVWDKTDNHWGIVLAKNINSGIVFGEQIANNGWVEINNNHGWWYNNFSYTYKNILH